MTGIQYALLKDKFTTRITRWHVHYVSLDDMFTTCITRWHVHYMYH